MPTETSAAAASASASAIEQIMIAVCGTGAVGKSCITIQYTQNAFVYDWDPTIEDAYRKHTSVDDKRVNLEILDTAGQDEFDSLRDTFMRTGEGFMVVFDVTNQHSWQEAVKFRQRILRIKDCDAFPMVFVGNKSDMISSDALRPEWLADVKKQCAEWSAATGLEVPYIEASALKRINIDQSFETLVRLVRKFKSTGPANKNSSNGNSSSNNKKNKLFGIISSSSSSDKETASEDMTPVS